MGTKREKEIVALTMKDIAEKAEETIRARIEAELPGDKRQMQPWNVNRIIAETIDSFIPRKTLGDMGVKVEVGYDGSTSTSRCLAQTVYFDVTLKRSHPFFCAAMKPDSMRWRNTVFCVQRQKEVGCLAFKGIKVEYPEELNSKTIVELCDQAAKLIISQQKSTWNAARTLMEFHDAYGQEELHKLLRAFECMKRLPAYHSGPDGIVTADWANRDELVLAGGMAPRTKAILEAAVEGQHVIPAGVSLSDCKAYLNDVT